jgi:hypothetical protein
VIISRVISSQLPYSFVKRYVIISRVIGILTSEFLTAKIGFKILSDIIRCDSDKFDIIKCRL